MLFCLLIIFAGGPVAKMLSMGERLKAIREKTGLSQRAMARTIGVTPNSYANYENDRRTIPAPALREFCRSFNVTADYVLGLADYPFVISTDDDEALVIAAKYRLLSREDRIRIAERIDVYFERSGENGFREQRGEDRVL